MKIKPLGNRLVIRKEKAKEETLSGIIVSAKKADKKGLGQVLEISDQLENKGLLNIGDSVIFKEEDSYKIDQTDASLFIIDFEDILAKIEE